MLAEHTDRIGTAVIELAPEDHLVDAARLRVEPGDPRARLDLVPGLAQLLGRLAPAPKKCRLERTSSTSALPSMSMPMTTSSTLLAMLLSLASIRVLRAWIVWACLWACVDRAPNCRSVSGW